MAKRILCYFLKLRRWKCLLKCVCPETAGAARAASQAIEPLPRWSWLILSRRKGSASGEGTAMRSKTGLRRLACLSVMLLFLSGTTAQAAPADVHAIVADRVAAAGAPGAAYVILRGGDIETAAIPPLHSARSPSPLLPSACCSLLTGALSNWTRPSPATCHGCALPIREPPTRSRSVTC